jgi:hypothetical protein
MSQPEQLSSQRENDVQAAEYQAHLIEDQAAEKAASIEPRHLLERASTTTKRRGEAYRQVIETGDTSAWEIHKEDGAYLELYGRLDQLLHPKLDEKKELTVERGKVTALLSDGRVARLRTHLFHEDSHPTPLLEVYGFTDASPETADLEGDIRGDEIMMCSLTENRPFIDRTTGERRNTTIWKRSDKRLETLNTEPDERLQLLRDCYEALAEAADVDQAYRGPKFEDVYEDPPEETAKKLREVGGPWWHGALS